MPFNCVRDSSTWRFWVAIFFSSDEISLCSSCFRSSIAASCRRSRFSRAAMKAVSSAISFSPIGAFPELLGKLDLLLAVGFGDQPGAPGDKAVALRHQHVVVALRGDEIALDRRRNPPSGAIRRPG